MVLEVLEAVVVVEVMGAQSGIGIGSGSGAGTILLVTTAGVHPGGQDMTPWDTLGMQATSEARRGEARDAGWRVLSWRLQGLEGSSRDGDPRSKETNGGLVVCGVVWCGLVWYGVVLGSTRRRPRKRSRALCNWELHRLLRSRLL